METKYTDVSFLHYVVINGSYRTSKWAKPTEYMNCVVALTSKYAFNNVNNRIVLANAVALDNGEYMGRISVDTIYSCRNATESEIQVFTDALAKINLCIDNVDIYSEVHPLGHPAFKRVETVTALAFKDPSAVRFLYKGNLLTKDEAMAIELADGESYLSHYDNGYSYESTDPVSADSFYKTAETLVNGTFKTECNGVWLTRMDNGEYAVKVLIGKNEHWSQQSNS